ncbi:ABC transporter ATP-binding protein [Labrys miyagiensis]
MMPAQQDAPLLSVRDLVTEFPLRNGTTLRAVDGVSFDLAAGSALGIVGESGSGKSVLIRSVLGIVDQPGRIAGGSICFKGKELTGLPEKRMRAVRGRQIAMIFQNPAGSLSPVATIADQFVEAIRAHERTSRAAALDRARHVLKAVGLRDADAILSSRPFELSGGLIQRVMIGLAMVAGPDLILADEPTTSLDVTVQEQIVGALRQVQRDFGTAILFISHDMGVISEISDRIMVMYGGKVIEEDGMEAVLTRPKAPYTIELIRAVPTFTTNGASAEPKPGISAPIPAAPLLAVDDLTVTFPGCEGRPAVSDVGFSIGSNEAIGIVGESGAGKSVLLRAIAGLYPVAGGSIRFRGQEMVGARGRDMKAFRRQMQIVFQNPYTSLPSGRRIRDILAEPLDIHAVARSEWETRIRDAIDGVRLAAEFLDRRPEQLSGGQRQRAAVARALVLKPSLLLLDEPVSALDVSIRSQVLSLLSDLRKEQGLGYVIVSHDFSVLRRLADRIAVMQAGRFVESGTAEAIVSSPADDYTRRLIAAIPTIERSLRRQRAAS